MAKAPPKLYKISEVAQYSGLSKQTISYYTVLGLIKPAGATPAKHRLYDASVFDTIEKIKELKQQGKTLAEIRDMMTGNSGKHAEGK